MSNIFEIAGTILGVIIGYSVAESITQGWWSIFFLFSLMVYVLSMYLGAVVFGFMGVIADAIIKKKKEMEREKERRQEEEREEQWKRIFEYWENQEYRTYGDDGQQQDRSRQENNADQDDFSDLMACCKFLGCDPGISDSDLKQLYLKLIKENHPDRLGPDISQEVRDFATERTKKITEAYNRIKKQRKMK